MTFWMGVIVGTGIGAFVSSVFYMFIVRLALSTRKSANDEFQNIQQKNGEHIARIADAIEKATSGT